MSNPLQAVVDIKQQNQRTFDEAKSRISVEDGAHFIKALDLITGFIQREDAFYPEAIPEFVVILERAVDRMKVWFKEPIDGGMILDGPLESLRKFILTLSKWQHKFKNLGNLEYRIAVCFQWIFKHCETDIDSIRPHPNAPVVHFPISARHSTSQPPAQIISANSVRTQEIASSLPAPPPNISRSAPEPGPSRPRRHPEISVNTSTGRISLHNTPDVPTPHTSGHPSSNPPRPTPVVASTSSPSTSLPTTQLPIQLIPKNISGAGVPKGFWASLEEKPDPPNQLSASPQPTANSGFVVMNPDGEDAPAPNWATLDDPSGASGEEDEEDEREEDELDELAEDDAMDTTWDSSAMRASPAVGAFGSLSRVQTDEKHASSSSEHGGTSSGPIPDATRRAHASLQAASDPLASVTRLMSEASIERDQDMATSDDARDDANKGQHQNLPTLTTPMSTNQPDDMGQVASLSTRVENPSRSVGEAPSRLQVGFVTADDGHDTSDGDNFGEEGEVIELLSRSPIQNNVTANQHSPLPAPNSLDAMNNSEPQHNPSSSRGSSFPESKEDVSPAMWQKLRDVFKPIIFENWLRHQSDFDVTQRDRIMALIPDDDIWKIARLGPKVLAEARAAGVHPEPRGDTSSVSGTDQLIPDSPSLRRRHSERDPSPEEPMDESNHPRKKRRSSAFVPIDDDDVETHGSPVHPERKDESDVNMFNPQQNSSANIPDAEMPLREATPELTDDMKHKVIRTIASVNSTLKFPERFFFDIELSEEEYDSVKRWSMRAEEMDASLPHMSLLVRCLSQDSTIPGEGDFVEGDCWPCSPHAIKLVYDVTRAEGRKNTEYIYLSPPLMHSHLEAHDASYLLLCPPSPSISSSPPHTIKFRLLQGICPSLSFHIQLCHPPPWEIEKCSREYNTRLIKNNSWRAILESEPRIVPSRFDRYLAGLGLRGGKTSVPS